MELTITFTRERETKNTVRFTEDERPGQPPVVGTLYIQKWAANDATNITVRISRTPTA